MTTIDFGQGMTLVVHTDCEQTAIKEYTDAVWSQSSYEPNSLALSEVRSTPVGYFNVSGHMGWMKD